MNAPQLSIVIPVYNEAGNLSPLLSEIEAAFHGRSYEVILVDDGSDQPAAAEVVGAAAPVRVLSHRRRAGKSRALMTGFRAAHGVWIATLDGDGQNDPADLAAIAKTYGDERPTFIVAGVREQRNDGVIKLLTSKSANLIRKWMLRDDCRDTGCGLKMMPGAFVRTLPYFDNMHRFFPALARRAGLDVVEYDISDRPRRHGTSKYGFFDRAAVALLDLIGVYWLSRRSSEPGEVSEQSFGSEATPATDPAPAQAVPAHTPPTDVVATSAAVVQGRFSD
ncbi:MAG: glycosyltransferase [Pseudomonadota bacterium]